MCLLWSRIAIKRGDRNSRRQFIMIRGGFLEAIIPEGDSPYYDHDDVLRRDLSKRIMGVLQRTRSRLHDVKIITKLMETSGWD